MNKLLKVILVLAAVLVGLVAAFFALLVWTNRPLPQSENDVVIVERTIALLGDESSWSRSDDRDCDPAEELLSLYCALQQASIEISGDFEHRSAALQEVRLAIERDNPGVEYAHRLMDFNNDEQTSFDDLHAVLQDALDHLKRNWQESTGR